MFSFLTLPGTIVILAKQARHHYALLWQIKGHYHHNQVASDVLKAREETERISVLCEGPRDVRAL